MITEKEVQHIAKLARISLTEKEKKKFQKELSLILDYFNLLKELNVKEVLATSHSVDIRNVVRKDEVKKENIEKRNLLIESAPEKKEGHIKVKAIL